VLLAQQSGSVMDEQPTEEERAYYSLQNRVWASFAPFYDLVVLPIRRLRRRVADMLELGPRSRVLDVATGTGEQAFAFAAKAGEVVGIDLSEEMLRVARRKNRFLNVSFRHADATRLPFDDKSFDVACASFALHEMPPRVRERVLREMARVTKTDGAIVIVDYALPKNSAASSLVFRFVKLYERDCYAEFVQSDLDALARSAGIQLGEHRSVLLGAAMIVIGRSREPRAVSAGSPVSVLS
jgi:demethylmenaquinone methyltransferase/2-methoxy-6-polyprenyl-1,4-benzoquinol methylase